MAVTGPEGQFGEKTELFIHGLASVWNDGGQLGLGTKHIIMKEEKQKKQRKNVRKKRRTQVKKGN